MTHLTPLTAVLLALAVYRVTVFAVRDYLFEPVRRFCRRYEVPCGQQMTLAEWNEWRRRETPAFWKHAAYFVGCPWCCSVWAAAVLTPLTAFVSWWLWVDAGLAASAVASIVFCHVNKEGTE